MKAVLLVLLCLCVIAVLILLTSYICFKRVFYWRQKESNEEFSLPPGKIYLPYRDQMIGWMKETREIPHTEFFITSFDGLKLYGNYYEYAPDAPIEIMFPGYKGLAERDLCGGVQRCFSLGRSVLTVDQRACGKSEGKIISFGINEKRDCLSWVDFAISHFGENCKLILTGISMGAATVLMAGGEELPKNVIGIIADCGYNSPREIIRKVIRDMRLPDGLLYPFVKLGARIFGGFDLEENSPIEAVKRCKVPVFFTHGETDAFVPHYMSKEMFEACKAEKLFLSVPDAGHGLCYIVSPAEYINALKQIEEKYLFE